MEDSLNQEPLSESNEAQFNFFFSQAYSAAQAGDENEALELYQHALSYHPQGVNAWVNMSAIHLGMNDLRLGEDCCRQALRIDPNYALAHHSLGNCLREKGVLFYDEAEAEYLASLSLESNNPDTHYNLAVLYSRITLIYGRVLESRKAIKHYEFYLRYRRHPDTPFAMMARKEIKRLLALDPLKLLPPSE